MKKIFDDVTVDMVDVFPTEKALKCPFCGGAPKVEAVGVVVDGSEFRADMVEISCSDCGITTGIHHAGIHNRMNFHDVLDIWNRRVGDYGNERRVKHMNLRDLKQCPHCGGQAFLCMEETKSPQSANRFFIMCGECGAQTCKKLAGGITGRAEGEVMDDLASLWNERI